MAAASSGIIQAAHIDWYVNGGDLITKVSEAFSVLEQGRIGPLRNRVTPAEPTRPRAPRKRIEHQRDRQ
jgi:hypothetical protein